MAGNDLDILSEAISETNKEIFAKAFDQEFTSHDESGDRSLEETGDGLEGQHEAGNEEETDADEEEADEGEDEADEESEAEPEPKKAAAEAEERQPPEGRVPSGKLREANEARRAVEAERDALKSQAEAREAKHREELAALSAKFDGVLAALQRQQPQPAQPKTETQPEVVPDLFEDPRAYEAYLERKHKTEIDVINRRFDEQRIETSMQLAHVRHQTSFEEAYQALVNLDKSNPENIAVGTRILKSPNPGEALVQWHKRNEVLRQVGDDPAKYRERIEADARKALADDPEFQRQVLEKMRADAATGDRGEPRVTTRLPKSLSTAAGTSRGRASESALSDGSQVEIFNSIFRGG